MFFKKNKSEAPFIKEASLSEDDVAGEEELNGVDAEAVDNEPPAQSAVKEDKDIAREADALLTPMGAGEEEGVTGEADAITQPVQLEKLLGSDVQADAALEKTEEEAGVKGEKEGKNGLLGNLFEEEEEEEDSGISSLIASLPDITAEELLGEAQELTALIREWQE